MATETNIAGGTDSGPSTQVEHTARASILSERKLTIKAAAELMGLGQTSLRRLIREDSIPVIQMGGKILILERDIEEYLQQHRVVLRNAPVRKSRLPAAPEFVVQSKHLS